MKAICTECGKRWDGFDPDHNGHIRMVAPMYGASAAGKVCGPVVPETDPEYAATMARLS